MDERALVEWFEQQRRFHEDFYLRGVTPWQQSGCGLRSDIGMREWTALRKPIADCVVASGPMLDVGCANGWLLECLCEWVAPRGITVDPWGIDLSEELVALARQRLPAFAQQIVVANAWTWTPPIAFTTVRTELVYVPGELQAAYVARVRGWLAPEGRLLVAEYRGRTDGPPHPTLDDRLRAWGFAPALVNDTEHEGRRVTIAVITAM